MDSSAKLTDPQPTTISTADKTESPTQKPGSSLKNMVEKGAEDGNQPETAKPAITRRSGNALKLKPGRRSYFKSTQTISNKSEDISKRRRQRSPKDVRLSSDSDDQDSEVDSVNDSFSTSETSDSSISDNEDVSTTKSSSRSKVKSSKANRLTKKESRGDGVLDRPGTTSDINELLRTIQTLQLQQLQLMQLGGQQIQPMHNPASNLQFPGNNLQSSLQYLGSNAASGFPFPGGFNGAPSHPHGVPWQGSVPTPKVGSSYRAPDSSDTEQSSRIRSDSSAKKKVDKGSQRPAFKRVDSVWDSFKRTFKLQDTEKAAPETKCDSSVFHVRRTFNHEGKHRATFVDIKSKALRECLQDVIKNVRGVSLVDVKPKLDPNLLFLYLDDLRRHYAALKHHEPADDLNRDERKRMQKFIAEKREHLKVLIKYLDKDYAEIKDSLYPMLENGLITFDLLWALWKPDTPIFSSTYGSEEPRAFKVEESLRHTTFTRGEVYIVQGKYFDFDGKRFGYARIAEEIPAFQGARKITSLPCYPLDYHKNEEQIRQQLIERGKKFCLLSGVHFQAFSGMAYQKNKNDENVKFNIRNSRVMVDAGTFRRSQPNYLIPSVRPRANELCYDEDGDSDGCGDWGSDPFGAFAEARDAFLDRHRAGTVSNKSTSGRVEPIPRKASGDSEENSLSGLAVQQFSDDDHLIASPVVLGFSFGEKQWLEFCVSGITEVVWNKDAWDSLVLDKKKKDLLEALVSSRKHNALKTTDDVIQGKGKGLVTVLHGPPGTGKTLTAEGIGELLKCPVYMASAGELSTDSRFLEAELKRILDICHTWGAILLIDEADVFLEKRDMRDVHRNALVSIFLRQLEYFQGILFLTTNRVGMFDDAFQSRIHIALRYEPLDIKAKKTIFKLFIERVRQHKQITVDEFSDRDFADMARNDLNGREIKNVIGSAQDLAINKDEALGMAHIRLVLEVHINFNRDLKGGTGYEDVMRSYT